MPVADTPAPKKTAAKKPAAKKAPAKRTRKSPFPKGTTVRATTSFSAGERVVTPRQILDADDPIVALLPGYFEPADAAIERASARPGEVRSVSIPKPEKKDEAPADDTDE